MTFQNKPQTKTCGRCGKAFQCHSPERGCWCEDLPPLKGTSPEQDCLCPSCLAQAIQAQQAAPRP